MKTKPFECYATDGENSEEYFIRAKDQSAAEDKADRFFAAKYGKATEVNASEMKETKPGQARKMWRASHNCTR